MKSSDHWSEINSVNSRAFSDRLTYNKRTLLNPLFIVSCTLNKGNNLLVK